MLMRHPTVFFAHLPLVAKWLFSLKRKSGCLIRAGKLCRLLSGVLAAILVCAWLLSFCVLGLVCDTGLRPCKLEMF